MLTRKVNHSTAGATMSKRHRGHSRQLRPDPAAANIRDPQQEQDDLEESKKPSEPMGQANPERDKGEKGATGKGQRKALRSQK